LWQAIRSVVDMTNPLVFDGVGKAYGDVHALRDVNLAVEQGQLLALLGPNGAGKTSAFELALNLTRPSSGQVRVFGRPPGDRQVVGRVGAMLQSAGTQENITVAEVVRLVGRSHPRARAVDDVLERVSLAQKRNRMITDLSGGERQRLLLGMAIVGVPDLLVLDEPTAAMDVASQRAFWDEARSSVADGTTIVFATHNLAEADQVADRVVILRDGQVVADATPTELKRQVHAKVVSFASESSAAALEVAIGRSGTLTDTLPHDGARWLHIVHSDDPAQLITELVAAGQHLDDLEVRDAELEDAFVALTTEPTALDGARP
jgi:ABC-2 type transport system ATP-binding protein